mmetsp:Transcript_4671/g.13363  ORF Transcript_4671/g.13363 Transcript_4671/m.13363 type:complete len:226 (+) Transcript_4671:1086-1763(+)
MDLMGAFSWCSTPYVYRVAHAESGCTVAIRSKPARIESATVWSADSHACSKTSRRSTRAIGSSSFWDSSWLSASMMRVNRPTTARRIRDAKAGLPASLETPAPAGDPERVLAATGIPSRIRDRRIGQASVLNRLERKSGASRSSAPRASMHVSTTGTRQSFNDPMRGVQKRCTEGKNVGGACFPPDGGAVWPSHASRSSMPFLNSSRPRWAFRSASSALVVAVKD